MICILKTPTHYKHTDLKPSVSLHLFSTQHCLTGNTTTYSICMYSIQSTIFELILSQIQNHIYIYVCIYTGYTQKNGSVSKVNKKFISRLTRAQRTPSAAAAVPVSHALITILQCVHPGSHDTHPHGNQIHPRLGVASPL